MGKNIARLRAKAGCSQTQLAARIGPKKLGVTQSYISELEAGKKNPTLTTLAALAEALDATLEDVVAADRS